MSWLYWICYCDTFALQHVCHFNPHTYVRSEVNVLHDQLIRFQFKPTGALLTLVSLNLLT